MARRQLQEINAGSMADIAFLLLIFFLVSTTMDTDSGILRRLPPMPEEETKDEQVDVKERNIFVVLVNRNDQLLVEGELMNIKDLREATKEFIVNPNDDPDLPAKEIVDVKYFGPVEITKKHVISLQNDRGTSYEMYIAVQNELVAAYSELRDELCMKKWGKKFDDLDSEKDEDKIEAVETIYDRKISEAEPRNVGG
ncbi:MAG: biopolymer transporter ExbD [Bacteroidales bacterium]|nr:biopolymer transporter ExbD [Bacteroidales bacterium]